MSVPLIQGTLRYAYKVAVLSDSHKGFGEGYAFMMSVIHRVNKCSVADAKIIYEALDIPIADPGVGGFKLGGAATAPGNGVAAFTAVKEAFERNYVCMGITCADVGALHDDNKLAMEGAEACIDSTTGGGGTDTTTEKDVLPTWAIIAIGAFGPSCVCCDARRPSTLGTRSTRHHYAAHTPTTSHARFLASSTHVQPARAP